MTQRRVLVAEDSPTQAAVLRAHLEDAGFEVFVAGNGAEALELMAHQPVDLVVSDVVMPDVDGYQLCAGVKERAPGVPVVLLTSMTDPLDVVHALSAGADNFLRKPYEPTELIHRVRNILHNKELRDSGRAQMGLELFFLGRRFMINADREQILDLLVSTFEDLVAVNQRLSGREEELAAARDELARRLQETEHEKNRLRAVLDAMPGGMAVFDPDGRIIHANDQLAELVGVPLHQLNGSLVWDHVTFVDHQGMPVPRELRTLHRALFQGEGAVAGTAFELFLQCPDGRRLPVISRAEPMRSPDGTVIGAVATLEDLGAVMDHDAVTGLPGHAALLDRLEISIRSAVEHADSTVGAAVIVIDRFQRFRDSMPGVDLDRLLATCARRLCQVLESPGLAQRTPGASATYLGNGEFAVVLPDVDGEDDAIAAAQHVVDGVAVEEQVDGVLVPVTVSAGVVICRQPSALAAVVAAAATDARAASRAGGGHVATSDPSRYAHVVDQLRREAELRTAIDEGQLVVHYQPELSVRDERPVALEALVRWEHPQRGLLTPADIIPLAIDAGLICPVGWLVLETACRQVASWHRQPPGGIAPVLSVNLAAEQLAERDVVDRIADILQRTGLDPGALVLEITEGTVMDDPAAARERLSRVKSLGCRIAVDDFGTGYSSLLQLRTLPVDVLKIDRSFVSGMSVDPADAAIVNTVIRLARALGLEVVAEGVEDSDQLVQLRLLGCDLGQGFHWAPAMPPEQLQRWWEHQAEVGSVTDGAGQPSDLLEMDEPNDEVLSYLVHELRTPLTAVKGFAELLRETMPDAARELVEPIVRNAQEIDDRLGSLREVDELLRGGMTLRTEDHDVVELIGTLVQDMAAQAGSHQLSFTASGGAVAAVDPVRLLQAVSNLITNALKFSPGGSAVEVGVEAIDGVVAIEVRDHGPGVPEERRPELFRRFSRLGSRATGLGLGLYIARLVAEAHGGVIAYLEADGGGALFSIRIPRRSTDRDFYVAEPSDRDHLRAAATGNPAAPGHPGPGASPEVLCVEDDPSTVALVRRVLTGYRVADVADVADARAILAGTAINLVVLDRHLGDVVSDELLDDLAGGSDRTPVVVLTAAADEELTADLLARGAGAVLPKPFRPEDLRRVVDALLTRRSAPPTSPQPEDGPEERTLDEDLVRALEEVEGAAGGFDQLVAGAVSDAQGHRSAMGAAVETLDRADIASHAHALRGTLGSFGARVVAERCAELATLARSADRPELERALQELDRAIDEAERALRRRYAPG